MIISLFLPFILPLFLPLVSGSALHAPLSPRGSHECTEHDAFCILERIPTGKAFCSSLLYPHGLPTKTKTVTKTATSKKCSTKTRKEVETSTDIDFVESTVLLPQLTKTEYSSTLLIPSGPTRSVNKRASVENKPSDPTPTALSTCKPGVVSHACKSLVPRTTATSTVTEKTTVQCTTTITSTSTKQREITSTYAFTVTPPPIVVSGTGTLTTTVPAACAGPQYSPNGPFPDGAIETFAQYPDQPVTAVECCVACSHTSNCVASEFDPDSDECGFLITNVTQSSGISATCPLGKFDYSFGSSGGGGADIFPGPCGK